jgi:hypothetical protein
LASARVSGSVVRGYAIVKTIYVFGAAPISYVLACGYVPSYYVPTYAFAISDDPTLAIVTISSVVPALPVVLPSFAHANLWCSDNSSSIPT